VVCGEEALRLPVAVQVDIPRPPVDRRILDPLFRKAPFPKVRLWEVGDTSAGPPQHSHEGFRALRASHYLPRAFFHAEAKYPTELEAVVKAIMVVFARIPPGVQAFFLKSQQQRVLKHLVSQTANYSYDNHTTNRPILRSPSTIVQLRATSSLKEMT